MIRFQFEPFHRVLKHPCAETAFLSFLLYIMNTFIRQTRQQDREADEPHSINIGNGDE